MANHTDNPARTGGFKKAERDCLTEGLTLREICASENAVDNNDTGGLDGVVLGKQAPSK